MENLRPLVFEKYGYQCLRCGSKEDIEIDHIKPRSKYPQLEELDAIDNLQPLCRDCNLSKGINDGPE